MINYHLFFGILGGAFSIVAFVPYIIGIFKKEVKPNRASWVIWNVTNLILLVSYFHLAKRL